jgi:membrane protease subunit HflC
MKTRHIVLVVSFVAAVIIMAATAFIVTEVEQVVITRLGKIKRVYRTPGLKFMLPLIEQKYVYPKLLLDVDKDPNKIPTSDKKYLIIDNFAKWRIIDPVKFKNTMITIQSAEQRINDLIFSTIRQIMGTYTLSEIVSKHREEIMQVVKKKSRAKADEFGIELVDVRIKRADLPPENEEAVYGRMRAERKQQAKKYRSEGDAEALKITAGADKNKAIILAEAYKKAKLLEGKGDAAATDIYARAFNRSPELYVFLKSMETYKKVLDTATTLVIPPRSELMQYFFGRK